MLKVVAFMRQVANGLQMGLKDGQKVKMYIVWVKIL